MNRPHILREVSDLIYDTHPVWAEELLRIADELAQQEREREKQAARDRLKRAAEQFSQ